MVVHWKKSCTVSDKVFSTNKNIFTKNNPNDRTCRSTQDRQERNEIQNPTKTISVKNQFHRKLSPKNLSNGFTQDRRK